MDIHPPQLTFQGRPCMFYNKNVANFFLKYFFRFLRSVFTADAFFARGISFFILVLCNDAKKQAFTCDCGSKTHKTLPCASSLRIQFSWKKIMTILISSVQLLVLWNRFVLMHAGNGALHVLL